tara:strand:- start:325 stop:1116 length:792 start_codon:yes stop_codon:yes gene_type:complete
MILDILSNTNFFKQHINISSKYINNKPYPHIVIDNFLENNFANHLHDNTRSTIKEVDVSNEFTQKNKTACNDWSKFGRHTYDFISFLNSSLFLSFLENTTNFKGLISDSFLEGGGIHSVSKNGFLKMHSDFNWHNNSKLYRRINVILYLNKKWQKDMKGELILSSKNFKNYISIEPIFNRLVIFNTNDKTYHGHPEKINFPEDYPRTSIATYYYTRYRPFSEVARFKSTTTKYIPFIKDDIKTSNISLKKKIGYYLRRFTPFG